MNIHSIFRVLFTFRMSRRIQVHNLIDLSPMICKKTVILWHTFLIWPPKNSSSHNTSTLIYESNYFRILFTLPCISHLNYVQIFSYDKLNMDGICRISSIKSDQPSSWFLIALVSYRYRERAIFLQWTD